MKQKLKVLLADDDNMTSKIIATALINNGCDVITVQNGQDAIDQFNNDNFDLVITDLLMPQIEGIEVISHIVDKTDKIKIIAMSSDASAGYTTLLSIAKASGAGAIIKKPINVNELFETIDNLFKDSA